MRVLMLVIMVMRVLVGMCYFGLLLGSLIRLCHLSRGQIHAFQKASVSAASSQCADERSTPLYYCTRLR